MSMEHIGLAIMWYAIFVVSTTFHEASHAFAAMKLGDLTAYHGGQVTLDPLPHIRREPFGMVIVPIVSFVLGGWMIGWASTPFDPFWAHTYRRRAALMALAGPLANLILILAAALAIRLGMLFGIFYSPESISFHQITATTSAGFTNSAAILISILFSLNLMLLVFNLIPVPPLDGSNIIMLFLSDRAAGRYNRFLAQPTIQIVGLIIAWQSFGAVFHPIHRIALNILYPGAGYY